MIATAPGKLILTGEYAVLDGAPALVIAVDRRVIARRTVGGSAELSPFLQAVADVLGDHYPRTGVSQILGEIVVDSSAFYDREHKLGLGSSAAVTVAATGLALASMRGEHPQQFRDDIFAVALAAHAAAQGPRGARGSGADVAAAVYGGTIVFAIAKPEHDPDGISIAGLGGDPTTPLDIDAQTRRHEPERPRIAHLRWPSEVRVLAFFTGTSADTATLVSRVLASRLENPDAVNAALEAVAAASNATCRALASKLVDATQVVAGFKLAAIAIDRLAIATGVDLVPACVTRAARAIARLGGTAKTTGAGGGDVGIAVIPATADVTEATRLLIEAGCQPLRLSVDDTGVDTRPGSQ